MEDFVYEKMSNLEANHWWFVGRRRIIHSVMQALKLPGGAQILEVGCGTGGNLAMLAEFGRVVGLEPSSKGLGPAARQTNAGIVCGMLPDQVPFPFSRFDCVVAFDVLEHIQDDAGALAAIFEHMKPGGRLLITVPAFKFLWSEHDVSHHHMRRYELGELERVVAGAGFEITKSTYINAWLFPVVALVRIGRKLLKAEGGDDLKESSPLVNGLLSAVFGGERHLIKFVKLPFGSSILLSACKPAA